MSQAVIEPSGGSTTNPWTAFSVIAVAIYLTILDLYIVNIAIPAIAADFSGSDLSSLSWVLTAYAVAFSAVLVPAGKLGDLYGRRRLFSTGLLVFVAGSAFSAVAGSLPFLIAGRVIQATGAGAMTPNSLGLALSLFPRGKRATVISAWGAIAGLGAASGPLAGSVLAAADWRWIFVVNLPIGLAGFALLRRWTSEVRDPAASGLPDVVGAAALAAASATLVLALSRGPSWDWDARFFGGLLAVAALAYVVFRRSSRHAVPIVELSLFRVRSFAAAMTSTGLLWAGYGAVLASSSLFLTGSWRYSILRAGLALAPGPAALAVVAAISGGLVIRFGATRMATVGCALFTFGALWQSAFIDGAADYASAFLPAQLLIGIGVGLTLPTLVAIALAEVPPTRFSTGAAVFSTFRAIGSALGVAAWVATLGTEPITAGQSFNTGWNLIAAFAALATVACALTSVAPVPTKPAAFDTRTPQLQRG